MSGLTGLNQLAEVARSARLAGDEFLPEIRKGLNKLGPPAKKAVQAAAQAKLPHRGGYAGVLARALRMRVKTDTGYTTAGVSLVTYAVGQAQRRDVPAINQGRLRRKVYGHADRWVTQRVSEGFWDDAMDTVSEDATARVSAVLDETVRKLKGR